jgi:hypothetical protein
MAGDREVWVSLVVGIVVAWVIARLFKPRARQKLKMFLLYNADAKLLGYVRALDEKEAGAKLNFFPVGKFWEDLHGNVFHFEEGQELRCWEDVASPESPANPDWLVEPRFDQFDTDPPTPIRDPEDLFPDGLSDRR